MKKTMMRNSRNLKLDMVNLTSAFDNFLNPLKDNWN